MPQSWVATSADFTQTAIMFLLSLNRVWRTVDNAIERIKQKILVAYPIGCDRVAVAVVVTSRHAERTSCA